MVIYLLNNFIKGKPLYENFCNFPHIYNPYPPVYYLILSFFAKLSKINSLNELLILCRFINLAITFIIFIVIFRIALCLGSGLSWGFISGLVFLGHPLLFRFGYSARVDLMAILFSLLSIYCIIIQKGKLGFYLSIFFALMAIYTKHQYISVFLSIIVYLLYKRRFKEAVNFFLYFFGVGLAVFLGVDYITQGAASLNLNVFNTIELRLSSSLNLFNLVKFFLLPNLILIAIGLFNRDSPLIFKIYALISMVLCIFSTMNPGAGTYYHLEIVMISALFFFPLFRKIHYIKRINTLFILFLSIIFIFSYARFGIALIRGRFVAEPFAYKDTLVEITRETRGYVLYDQSLDVIVLADKPVVTTCWCCYSVSVKKGICNDFLIAGLLDKRKFGCLIIKDLDWLTPAMREAINKNYIWYKRIEGYNIYLPVR